MLSSMKTLSKPVGLIGAAVLLALFLTGVIAGNALAVPIPSSVVGLALVLLGLRLGVMAAAVEPSSSSARQPPR